MRKTVKFLFILLLVLIPVLLIAPGFIDWTNYRPIITAKLTEALGRPIDIEGDISLRILPNPALTVEKVTIPHAFEGTKTPYLFSLEKLEAGLALLPLFRGHVQAGEIRFIQPQINLEVLADGRQSWVVTHSAEKEVLSESETKQSSEKMAAPDVKVDNIVIKDGVFSFYNHQSKTQTDVKGLNFDISIESLFGPYSAQGTLSYNDQPLKIEAAAGRFVEGEAIPVSFTTSYGESLADVGFSGVVNLGTEVTAKGEIKAESQNLSHVLKIDHTALKAPFALRGVISYSESTQTLNDVKANLGEIDLAAKGISVSSNNDVQLDQIALSFPAGMTAVITGKTSLKDQKFSGQIAAKGSDLKASLGPVLGDKAFEGIDPAVLKNVVFSADIAAAQNQYIANNVKIAVGDIRAGGNISYIQKQNIPHLKLDLAINALDLAHFGINSEKKKKPAGGAGTQTSKPQAKNGSGLPVTEFDIGIKSLAYAPWLLKDLRAVGKFEDGALDLKNLSFIDQAGLKIAVSGDIADVFAPTGLNLNFSAETGNLDPFLKAQGQGDLLKDGRSFGAMKVSGLVKGRPDSLTFNTKGTVAKHSFALEGGIKDIQKTPEFNLKTRLQSQNLAHTVRFVQPGTKGIGDPGPLDFYATLSGTPKKVKLSDIQAKIGKANVTGEAEARFSDALTKLEASVQTSFLPLDALMGLSTGGAGPKAKPASQNTNKVKSQERFSSEAFNLDWPRDLEASVNFTANTVTYGNFIVNNSALVAQYKDGALDITQLDGQAFGGKIGLTGRLESTGQTLKTSLKTNVASARIESFLKAMDIPQKLSGILNFNLEAQTRGNSTKQLVSGLAGKGGMYVTNGVLSGLNLDAVKNIILSAQAQGDLGGILAQGLEGGSTQFKDMSAEFNIDKGVVRSQNVVLSAGDVDMVSAVTVNLPAWRFIADSEIRVLDPEGVPPFDLKLSGPMDGTLKKDLASSAFEGFLKNRIRNEIERKVGKELEDKLKDKIGGDLFDNIINELAR